MTNNSIDKLTAETAKALLSGHVSQRQFRVLEEIISRSPKMTHRAKQALLYLIRESDFLSKNLVLTIPYEDRSDDDFIWGEEMVMGHHDYSDVLYEAFNLMGFGRRIGHHHGAATQIANRAILFETGWSTTQQERVSVTKQGWTLWLSVQRYQKTDIDILPFDREKILAMEVINS